jgi:nucleoside 2-deoxyribosyltransferase
MSKIEWMPLIGVAEIEENKITYHPEMITPSQQDQKPTPQILQLTSNVEFENGEITLDLTFSRKESMCDIILNDNSGTNPLHIGMMSREAPGNLFSMMEFDKESKQWIMIEAKGDNRNLKLNTAYHLKVRVKGSKISYIVNNVPVIQVLRTILKSPLKLSMRGDGEIIAQNIDVQISKPIAFVVMQFSDEYNQLYQEVIAPTCESKGFECIRASDKYTTNPVIQDIIESIHDSSIIIANITPDNPNVFYEVGFAHAINKPTILICDRKREKLPFDLSSFRTLFYDNTIAGKTIIERDLSKYLDNISNRDGSI